MLIGKEKIYEEALQGAKKNTTTKDNGWSEDGLRKRPKRRTRNATDPTKKHELLRRRMDTSNSSKNNYNRSESKQRHNEEHYKQQQQ